MGNRYGTGTVSAITAGGGSSGVQFSHVPDPYDVLDEPFDTGRVQAVTEGSGGVTFRFSRAGRPTRQERQQSASDDPRDVFTGVQFRAVKNPLTVQEVLENARQEP